MYVTFWLSDWDHPFHVSLQAVLHSLYALLFLWSCLVIFQFSFPVINIVILLTARRWWLVLPWLGTNRYQRWKVLFLRSWGGRRSWLSLYFNIWDMQLLSKGFLYIQYFKHWIMSNKFLLREYSNNKSEFLTNKCWNFWWSVAFPISSEQLFCKFIHALLDLGIAWIAAAMLYRLL